MQNYIEAVHDELDEALEKITKLEAERDEARRWASVWKRAAKYHREWNMYFEKKCFEWQGRYFKMKDRAEAAEQRVQELERINQQLLEALEKIEYKGRNANANNRLAIWMGDTARAVIAMVKGGE